MNNAELIVKVLAEAGIRWAFGIPSGPVLPLIEAMRTSEIEYVITAHEGSAGFMATAVGELTGVPGICVSTVGPGATNLATGVGAAWLDRRPLIAITCNVPSAWLERRIQMRIDHHALFAPLTKATLALRADNVGEVLTEALRIALEEPPGPVHLDVPEDVLLAAAARKPEESQARALPLADVEPPGWLNRLRDALAGSHRPLLALGLSATRMRPESQDTLLRFCRGEQHPLT